MTQLLPKGEMKMNALDKLYEGSAERAAAWLDVRYPGWHEKIDLDTLDLNDCELCVGGQMFPGEEGAWMRLVQECHSDGVERVYFSGRQQTKFFIEQIEKRRAPVREKVLA